MPRAGRNERDACSKAAGKSHLRKKGKVFHVISVLFILAESRPKRQAKTCIPDKKNMHAKDAEGQEAAFHRRELGLTSDRSIVRYAPK